MENEPCNFNKDVVIYMDERSYLPKLLSSHPAHTVSGEKLFYLPFLLLGQIQLKKLVFIYI